jgi:hypothetical protein
LSEIYDFFWNWVFERVFVFDAIHEVLHFIFLEPVCIEVTDVTSVHVQGRS